MFQYNLIVKTCHSITLQKWYLKRITGLSFVIFYAICLMVFIAFIDLLVHFLKIKTMLGSVLYVMRHEIFGPAALTSFFRNRGETKIIKLRLETRLKSQSSDWLKW